MRNDSASERAGRTHDRHHDVAENFAVVQLVDYAPERPWERPADHRCARRPARPSGARPINAPVPRRVPRAPKPTVTPRPGNALPDDEARRRRSMMGLAAVGVFGLWPVQVLIGVFFLAAALLLRTPLRLLVTRLARTHSWAPRSRMIGVPEALALAAAVASLFWVGPVSLLGVVFVAVAAGIRLVFEFAALPRRLAAHR